MLTKKVPMRKCVATQESCPKKDLIRVVRNKDGEVFIDEKGKQNGRGAYIKRSLEALDVAIKKNALGKALETSIPESIYDELKKIIDGK